jgi:hypothetical protein
LKTISGKNFRITTGSFMLLSKALNPMVVAAQDV